MAYGSKRWNPPWSSDLSIYSRRDLDRISESLDTRPRAVLGFRTPKAALAEECKKLEAAARPGSERADLPSNGRPFLDWRGRQGCALAPCSQVTLDGGARRETIR